MDVQQAPTPMAESREQRSYVRLQGRWLLLARVGWVGLVILTLAIFFSSLPSYIALLQTPCAGPACEWQQLTPGQVGTLKEIGLSLVAYTAYMVALMLVSVMVCLAVSAVIVWRRSHDRMALFAALMLVTLGPVLVTAGVVESSSPWQVPNEGLAFLSITLLVLVFLLFPSGQFVPHWTRWILVVFLFGQVSIFFPGVFLIPNTQFSRLDWLVVLGELVTLAIIQLYRYRRVSSPPQRQQTKWVVFGFAVPITVYAGGTLPALLFPVLNSPSSLYLPAFVAIQASLQLMIPLSFGFAMLRSRLWEIDVLINRTLVYGTLTASLALVIGLQALLRGIINQGNSVAIVLSTLAIAALFQPLRRRIQRIIDLRFYRSKYDAAKTVAAFSATLRQEVDLDQLREQLLAVVQETMQPSHVSLWVRPPEHDETQRTPWRATPPGSSEGK
jgi:hypothetical protein